ncbi:hypothetical protein [Bacteroides oleiciplenus]|uniref:Peptide-N(4)-(N-acetyl-beta-glucosaminyl)asparagine amidase n=1 Tax=Bacteroides oleiciplenus TaxID=626931 RepID=A0A3E5BE40_9BACE|nr:hypothetical protein [Bacteroides oleiciplenus]RGN35881.1 hypothetical protein DXB65_10220 [Bacteroides oleiciplenus]
MQNKISSKLSLIILFVFFLASCKEETSDINDALEQAGANRAELEKVLAHYQGDSLKLEAARFLIKNMPMHYSYKGNTADNYYDMVDSIVRLDLPVREMIDSLEVISANLPVDLGGVVSDVRIITDEFLITNIDRAFELWQEGEWATHLSFQDFCEYLLPYKLVELQPLDDWRCSLDKRYISELEKLKYCVLYKNSAVWAARLVNINMKDNLNPEFQNNSIRPVYRFSTKFRTPFGTCIDYALMTTAVMRSCGIPIAIDFTPQWPFRSQGHSWNVVLANSGKNIPFGGLDTNPGEPHKLDEKMAKVYRHTYAVNLELLELLNVEKYVPRIFKTPFFKDVTREYMDCEDVTIKVSVKNNKYAYLAVFDNHSWVPVTFGKISSGKAYFKDMGPNIVYLPVCYSDGEMKPCGNPFLLTYSGTIKELEPDSISRQKMILYRKYPMFPYVQDIAGRILGGEFQASNDKDFADALTLHKIKEWGMNGEEVEVPPQEKLYRYWRFYQPEHSFGNIAEIAFVERNSQCIIQGEIIGTNGTYPSSPNLPKEVAFDGNLLTFFDAPIAQGAWVGMDFKRPVDIGKIIYVPRGDGNAINIDELYELFYWDGECWVSAGRQKATTVRLYYEQIPSGAIYLLRNLTTGKDERIFTYKDGEQIFW